MLFAYDQPCRWNLVISHRRRKQINTKLNRYFCPAEGQTLFIPATQTSAKAGGQDMFIWPGVQLLGCVVQEKRGVRNGCLYTIDRIEDEDKVFLHDVQHAFTLDQVRKWLRLSFAQTYASCQGTEFDGSLCLWDTNHIFFTRRHLFVGLSRAKDGSLVCVRS